MARSKKASFAPSPINKASLESSMEELRARFDEASKELEQFIASAQSSVEEKKQALTKMQGEYQGLKALLTTYRW